MFKVQTNTPFLPCIIQLWRHKTAHSVCLIKRTARTVHECLKQVPHLVTSLRVWTGYPEREQPRRLTFSRLWRPHSWESSALWRHHDVCYTRHHSSHGCFATRGHSLYYRVVGFWWQDAIGVGRKTYLGVTRGLLGPPNCWTHHLIWWVTRWGGGCCCYVLVRFVVVGGRGCYAVVAMVNGCSYRGWGDRHGICDW